MVETRAKRAEAAAQAPQAASGATPGPAPGPAPGPTQQAAPSIPPSKPKKSTAKSSSANRVTKNPTKNSKLPSKKPSRKPTKKPTKKQPRKKTSARPPSPAPLLDTDTPPSSTDRQPFRAIHEGSGNTLTIHDTSYVRALGTGHCNTCVGIYVPLTSTRAFIAHFNLELVKATGSPFKKQSLKNYEVNPECYRAVVMLTKEFLNTEQWKGGWGKLTAEMGRGLRMVCPRAGVEGKVYTGDAVVEGVREFFGGGAAEEVGEVRQGANIIVVYPAPGEDGEREVPLEFYPDEEELEWGWVGVYVVRNDNFACADIRKDGSVLQGGEWEGPYRPITDE